MIKLIEKQKIIITYLQEGKSQRQIAREMDLTHLSIKNHKTPLQLIFVNFFGHYNL